MSEERSQIISPLNADKMEYVQKTVVHISAIDSLDKSADRLEEAKINQV